MKNETNEVWQQKLKQCLDNYTHESSPRGMKIREVVNGHYSLGDMPVYIDLEERKPNLSFMFAEAAWILEGSNRLSKIKPFMAGYARFSDDGVFMSGGYGPQVVENLRYIVDTLEKDNDSRQAFFSIWRNRPGISKDLPCTTSMQYILRDGRLHVVVNMRSQDIVLGFTYDVFTFSMISLAVSLLLRARGVQNELGAMYVNAGSMHLYEDQFENARRWLDTTKTNPEVRKRVDLVLGRVSSYDDLIEALWEEARNVKESV